MKRKASFIANSTSMLGTHQGMYIQRFINQKCTYWWSFINANSHVTNPRTWPRNKLAHHRKAHFRPPEMHSTPQETPIVNSHPRINSACFWTLRKRSHLRVHLLCFPWHFGGWPTLINISFSFSCFIVLLYINMPQVIYHSSANICFSLLFYQFGERGLYWASALPVLP